MRINDIFGLFGRPRFNLGAFPTYRRQMGQVKSVDTYLEEHPLPEVPENAPDIYMEKYEDAQNFQQKIMDQSKRTEEENASGPVDYMTEYRQTEELDQLIKEYERQLEDLEVERQLLQREHPEYGPIPTPFIPYSEQVPVPARPPAPTPPTNPYPEFGSAPFAQMPPKPPYAPVATGGSPNPSYAPAATEGSSATGCPVGQFSPGPGQPCRGSVGGGFGNLMNQAMNLGPSGAAQAMAPGNLDINPANLTANFSGMGRRSFPVVNL